jgi:hypothetical protein
MISWRITKDELYKLAKRNTLKLLPPVIKTMNEIVGDLLKDEFEEQYDDRIFDDLFEIDSERPVLYVLSNAKKINGAGCILYDNCLKDFAMSHNSDVIILPSSVHEVILVPNRGENYMELREMVCQINESEVPEEEVLSDRIYRYSCQECNISLVE